MERENVALVEAPDVQQGKMVQVCEIKVNMFNVSDEDALRIKRQLGDLLPNSSNVRVTFTLTTIPNRQGFSLPPM